MLQPLRMLVQSEPHSHTEYVHFEPSPVMVSLGRIKDFHVVRALKNEKSLIETANAVFKKKDRTKEVIDIIIDAE